jgi:virginiamycin B lyase
MRRRTDLIRASWFIVALGAVILTSAHPVRVRAQAASDRSAAGARTDGRLGGPFGSVKTVLRGQEQPVDGLMVQLIAKRTSIRTTVYTNELGQFDFPKLESGEYVLRIPRPMEFHRYQVDPVRIDGATSLPDIVVERVSEGLFLPPTKEILAQLSGAEWLANMPGTAQEKRLFTNSCTNSCHSGERPFMVKFDKAGWEKIVARMTNYSHRVLTQPSERTELTPNAKIIANWLATVRGPESEYPPIEPFPRPAGLATRAIVTEYELPWAMTNIHDIAGDAEGNVWFNVNRSPFVGKLDPKTGKIVTYRMPEPYRPTKVKPYIDKYTDPPGIHPGQHGLFIDKNTGYVYSTGTWHRSITRIDPRTGDMKAVMTDLTQNGNMALHPDGKSIWRTDQRKIKKYDLPGVFETGLPVQTWDLKNVNNTYGNFMSRDGRYFGGGGSWIVWLDTQTGELREIPLAIGGARGRGSFDAEGNIWSGAQKLTKYEPKTGAVTQYTPPTPYYHSYSAQVDKNGDVWSGQQQGGRIGRFNPKTGLWIEYVLPSPWSFDYMSYIDNSTNPPTFWYGDQHGYIVRLQPLD